MAQFKFSDSVSLRCIQIFQEAVLTGVDGADLFRLVRLQPSVDDPEVLELTPEYKQQVKEGHERQVSRSSELLKAMEQQLELSKNDPDYKVFG